MTRSPEALDQRHLLHCCHDAALQAEGLIWAQGRGATLIDHRGREFLDGISGLWNVLLGYGREELVSAATTQLRQLAFASTYAGSGSLPAVQLAAKLAELCYPDINKFYFTTSGAEANEAAFKTARYFWKRVGHPGKTHIIARRGDYHGTTFAALSATGMDKYLRAFEPRMRGFSWIDGPPHCQTGATKSSDANVRGVDAANLLEAEILRIGAEHVAAFVAEPIVGVGGVYVPPPDYWPRIREVCDRHDVLLIADEVLTGFGRTGDWFALTSYNVQPDIVVFAKGITSGYVPLGGIGLHDTIGELIATGTGETAWLHAATNSAHPVACAVALENLAILEREHLLPRAAEFGSLVRQQLSPLVDHPLVREIRGIGLLWAIELDAAACPNCGFQLLAEARKRGLFTRARTELFHLAPCLTIEIDELQKMIAIIGESLNALS